MFMKKYLREKLSVRQTEELSQKSLKEGTD